MTINKTKLIELLVEKTSMSEEEIKIQLDQLIERILDAAKRGKALEIKEFGVFYFDEEGKLEFNPAEELSTEISFKYAGMKPVEMKPERDTSIPGDIDDFSDIENEQIEEGGDLESDIEEDEEDPFESSLEDPIFEDPEESDSKSEKMDKSTGLQEKEEADPFDLDNDEEKVGAEKETEKADQSDLYDDDPFVAKKEQDNSEKSKIKLDKIKPFSNQPAKKKDNTGVWILIAIVVVAVLIGGYFYYLGTQVQNGSGSAQSSVVNPVESNPNSNDQSVADPSDEQSDTQSSGNEDPQMISDDQSTGDQSESGQGSEDLLVSDSDDSSADGDSNINQNIYGLNGSITEEANDGYSIVVHSFRDEINAQEAADRLREDNYRVMVQSRTVYDNEVWRVSVGQFQTLGDAQRATTQLPVPYNTQNFIQRIRLN